MDTVIQTQGFKLTPSLERYTHSQIQKALRCCAENIEHVVIRLKDINGPKGGDDKHCSVELKLTRRPLLVISKASDDMYHSVKQTSKRAARTALRQLKRRRALRLKRKLKTKE